MDESNPYLSAPEKKKEETTQTAVPGNSGFSLLKRIGLYIVGGVFTFIGIIALPLEAESFLDNTASNEPGITFGVIASFLLSGVYMLYLGYSRHHRTFLALLGIFSISFALWGVGSTMDDVFGPKPPEWEGAIIMISFFTLLGGGLIAFASRGNK